MLLTSKLYENAFDFRRFWSIDDKQINPKRSIRQSIVMTDYDEMTQEFVKYNAGAGIHRVALKTNDIIKSVSNLRARGVEFMPVAAAYYSHLAQSLETAKCKVVEPLAVLEQLGIRVDSDNEGYLLQIFTKPLVDRPTLSIEIIQRVKCKGVITYYISLKYEITSIFSYGYSLSVLLSAGYQISMVMHLYRRGVAIKQQLPSDIGRLAVIESTRTDEEDLDGEGNQFYTQTVELYGEDVGQF
ncbi:hypothetical protein CcCBS67573_g06192 [Chytriomyces confervae]|uniref:4-hydroxyphenylpyruvate dioxygenase n=1 Tax=Chytriomyces confervae TaxID=246404 RepID=A0A507F4Z0_9FUNG|nr:hypothetical protein CcCBS67573_g06192 [Chytriomyces confervae]